MTPTLNTANAELAAVLKSAPIVPLVQSNDPDEAVRISEALLKGGLKVLEVVLRLSLIHISEPTRPY